MGSSPHPLSESLAHPSLGRTVVSIADIQGRLRTAYYGWWVLAATFTLAVFSGGIFSHSSGVFFGHIKRDLVLNNTQTSLIFSLTRAEGSITGPIVGRLVDRFGSRPMILVGGLMACFGFMALHWVSSYWAFVLIFVGIVATGRSSGMGHTLISAVNRWFVGKKSLALSIQIIGFQMGGAAILPLIVLGVHSIGWRDVMLYSAIFMAFILIPLAMVVRHSPERMGIEPEGIHRARRQKAVGGVAESPDTEAIDFTVREALATRTFWIMLAIGFIRISVWGSLAIHAVQIFEWEGLGERTAGFMWSLMFFLAMPATLGAGLLGLRFPPQPLLFVTMAGAGLGVALLLMLDGLSAVLMFVVLTAVAEGGHSLHWTSMGHFFGRRSFATLFGINSACFNVGMVLLPLYAGWIRDTHNESYTLVLVTFAPLQGVAALLYLLMRRPPPPRRELTTMGNPDPSMGTGTAA